MLCLSRQYFVIWYCVLYLSLFFFTDTAAPAFFTYCPPLSLHDALPISLIGFLVAWSLIFLSQREAAQIAPVDVLWCVALPVLDSLAVMRSEEHTSELQSLMRNSYAVFCLKKKIKPRHKTNVPGYIKSG